MEGVNNLENAEDLENAEGYRVQKLLSNYGHCSRRKAEELIEAGRVKVNNKVISLGDKATEQDKIFVDDKLIIKEKRVYVMFNKPVKCVTALRDRRYNTVMDFIKLKQRVFPIGRLDFNTSGLLLLTNDGDFANEVMHPSFEIKKTYLAGVDRPITKLDTEAIEKGIYLDDGKTSPANVKLINERTMEITIHEGKNRIVRRMLKKLNFRIRFVHRVKIGGLALGELKTGEYKTLSESMKRRIFEQKSYK